MDTIKIYPPTIDGFSEMFKDFYGKPESQGELTEKERDEQGEQDILQEAKGREKNEPYYNK